MAITDNNPWKYCTHSRKKIKMTKTKARTVANQMSKQENDSNLSFYKCKWCKSWHVGHNKKEKGL